MWNGEEPIKIFNNGDFDNHLYRDFTYIDDIVEGIERLIGYTPVKHYKCLFANPK